MENSYLAAPSLHSFLPSGKQKAGFDHLLFKKIATLQTLFILILHHSEKVHSQRKILPRPPLSFKELGPSLAAPRSCLAIWRRELLALAEASLGLQKRLLLHI